MTTKDLKEIFGEQNVFPIGSHNSTHWLEEHRDLYESAKGMRILHSIPDGGGIMAEAIRPDDIRYNDLKDSLLVQNYRRCLEIQEELDLLVKQMIEAGY